MDKIKKDIFMYCILVIISILFYFVIIPQQIQLRDSWSGDITFTSRTFPNLLFITLGITSVVGVISSLFKISKLTDKSSTPIFKNIKNISTPLYFFVLLAVYAAMFHYLGYLISTAVIIPLYLVSLRCKNIKYYVITYIIGIAVYIVFKFLLNIAL